jgi:hypothetical protein
MEVLKVPFKVIGRALEKEIYISELNGCEIDRNMLIATRWTRDMRSRGCSWLYVDGYNRLRLPPDNLAPASWDI